MYGTIAGVKAKAKQYTVSFERQAGYLDTEITNALEEASLFADQLLVKRYNLAAIKASVPAIVDDYTEIRAYIYLLTSLSQADGSYPTETINQLKERIRFIEKVYLNGDLLDNTGAIIDYNIVGSVIEQPIPEWEEEEEEWA